MYFSYPSPTVAGAKRPKEDVKTQKSAKENCPTPADWRHNTRLSIFFTTGQIWASSKFSQGVSRHQHWRAALRRVPAGPSAERGRTAPRLRTEHQPRPSQRAPEAVSEVLCLPVSPFRSPFRSWCVPENVWTKTKELHQQSWYGSSTDLKPLW